MAERAEHERLVRVRHVGDREGPPDLGIQVGRGAGGVQGHVHGPEEDLAGVSDPDVDVARLAHLGGKLRRKRLTGAVVACEPAQDRWLPDPVLHDLGRCLDEVPLGVGAAEPRVGRRGQAHVQDVAELVEERLELPVRPVAQKRRPIRRGWREVRDDGVHRAHVLAVLAAMPHHQRKRRSVPVLALAREEVRVEVRQELARRTVVDGVEPDRWVPGPGIGQLLVAQPEHLAGQLEHAAHGVVERQVLAHRVLVDAVLVA